MELGGTPTTSEKVVSWRSRGVVQGTGARALVGHPPLAGGTGGQPPGIDQVRVLNLGRSELGVVGHEVGLHDGRRHQAAIFDRFQPRAEAGPLARRRLCAPGRRGAERFQFRSQEENNMMFLLSHDLRRWSSAPQKATGFYI